MKSGIQIILVHPPATGMDATVPDVGMDVGSGVGVFMPPSGVRGHSLLHSNALGQISRLIYVASSKHCNMIR
jgi:hypothetical protein